MKHPHCNVSFSNQVRARIGVCNILDADVNIHKNKIVNKIFTTMFLAENRGMEFWPSIDKV